MNLWLGLKPRPYHASHSVGARLQTRLDWINMPDLVRRSCLVVAAAVALAACDVRVGEKGVSVGLMEGKAADRWERSYTLPAGGRLEIVNVAGPIRVSRSDGPGITVRIDREAEGSSDEAAKEALQSVQILEEVASDRVKVEVRRDRGDGGRWRGRQQVSSAYEIQVPAGITASFRTENGPVELNNVHGTIAAVTTNGAVNGRGLSGALTASTVNGGLQLSMDSVDGAVDLTAVNGGVRLELAPGVKANVVAAAVNGGVTIDQALNLSTTGGGGSGRGMLGSNKITGSINGGGPTITAQTTNGGVRIMARGASPDSARGR